MAEAPEKAVVNAAEYFKQRLEERKPYYAKRVELFEKYKAREDAKVEAAKAEDKKIKVVMPDGAVREAVAWVTTPLDIAKQISAGLAKKAIVAKVDGETFDMFRPLEADCALEILSFEDPDGKETYWHSSAHVLGQALELNYGVDLCIGPAIEEGFYYDAYIGDATMTDGDKDVLKKAMEKVVKEKQKFERVVVSRDEALSMFLENKFKVEIITALPETATISLYRNGPMVDLCHGPHVPNTGYLTAVAVNQASRAYWRADAKKESLQRVYGVTFPDKKLMAEYHYRIEEAKKRDHRTVGLNQELFFFHQLTPGSAFFLPNGTKIYNTLIEYLRTKYWEQEYDEVISPNIYNFDLWKTSGHAEHYKDNMFVTHIEQQEFGLKPMNCPGHCLMFGMRKRSWRELPLRLADFGVLHRNEASGALHGLTRVRRFQQDDAHIFCREDQIEVEVTKYLEFMSEAYGILGLEYEMALSTRPEGYLGELEMWNKAEAALERVLNATGKPWKLNPEDGAFYGPKIDITVFDALRRRFQCATVQLDFQLPIRFNLSYATEDGMARPVIIHRAVMGSMERMIAILTEHFAGKWPLWLSPRQVMIVPISENSVDYALSVKKTIRAAGFHVDADVTDRKMQKKVREAQLQQWNYILVVGEQEAQNGTVNVRTRDNHVHGMHSISSLLEALAEEKTTRSLVTCFKATEGEAEAAAAPADEA